MSDEARKRPRSIVGRALLLLGGLTLYVLSIGPVGWLTGNTPSPVVKVALDLIYLPLGLIFYFLPWIPRVLIHYYLWWHQ